MNLSELQGEEKLLLARLQDLWNISVEKYIPRFTAFLNERQAAIAEEFAAQRHLENTMLYGGYSDAVRRVAGFFPPQASPDTAAFPFTAVDIRYKRDSAPGHRDFLGSLMGLQIKRECVGDMLIGPELCTVFLLDTVVPVVLDDLCKVGRVGVRCEISTSTEFAAAQTFTERRGTVSSRRLDCLVSLLANTSRDKSAALIRSELVQHNYTAAHSGKKEFAQGDSVTIRGYGKFVVDEIGSPTRKGRLPVCYRKYD